MRYCKCGKEIKSKTGNACLYCANSIRAIKHNESKSKLYAVWSMIKQRCNNKNSQKFKYYGERNIKICNEWENDFTKFKDWCMSNGYKEGLEIDRIDNNGNYEPTNCRFANRSLQIQNTRTLSTNTTGYRGVYFEKSRNKYVCRITTNGKTKYIGRFKTAKEASKAFNEYVLTNNLNHTLNKDT